MTQAKLPRRYFTPEEYLTIERLADFKSQYLAGELYAMSGGSPEHSALIANVIVALAGLLRGKPCRVFDSNLRVRTSAEGLYSYPDAMVVCGELRFHDEKRDTLTNPTVLAEVLSPSTEAFDRGLKFDRYKEIESLTDYLLIAQETPRIEHYRKRDDGTWAKTEAQGLDARLWLTTLEGELRLAEVYDRIEFEPPIV